MKMNPLGRSTPPPIKQEIEGYIQSRGRGGQSIYPKTSNGVEDTEDSKTSHADHKSQVDNKTHTLDKNNVSVENNLN